MRFGIPQTIYYDVMVSVNTLDDLMNLIHCDNNEIWIYDGNIE